MLVRPATGHPRSLRVSERSRWRRGTAPAGRRARRVEVAAREGARNFVDRAARRSTLTERRPRSGRDPAGYSGEPVGRTNPTTRRQLAAPRRPRPQAGDSSTVPVMKAETILTMTAAVTGVASAGAAFWQAAIARKSAKSAATNEVSAARSARDAADAGLRSAAALEEANQLRREQARRPHWTVQAQSTRLEKKVWIRNTGSTAYDVEVTRDKAGRPWSDTFPAKRLEAGLGGTVSIPLMTGMPEDLVLRISWSDEPEGDRRETSVTV